MPGGIPLKNQTKHNTPKPMANVNIKPLGDRVLVHPLEEKEVKKGGIIIPDTAKEKPQEGEVVALGTGKRDDDGKLINFTVKKRRQGSHLEIRGNRSQSGRRNLSDHARGRHPRHHRLSAAKSNTTLNNKP